MAHLDPAMPEAPMLLDVSVLSIHFIFHLHQLEVGFHYQQKNVLTFKVTQLNQRGDSLGFRVWLIAKQVMSQRFSLHRNLRRGCYFR